MAKSPYHNHLAGMARDDHHQCIGYIVCTDQPDDHTVEQMTECGRASALADL